MNCCAPKSKYLRIVSWCGLLLIGLVGLFGLLMMAGCREVPVDRLYAIHLDHMPTDHDWDDALPRLVTVRGGYRNVPSKLGAIDEDTVHTSTPSCHHGAALPDPLDVDMRAFYTDDELFVRLSWVDPTRDDEMRQWLYDGESWTASADSEDGFGLMWDAEGRFPRFSCSYACHIDDFGVSGANFHARNRMRLDRTDALVDLWHWKAGRTGRSGFVDDRYLDEKGMKGDLPGELFRPNSAAVLEGKEPFSDADRPLYDYESEPVSSDLLLAGTVAPGYLVEKPSGGRADISSISRYQNGAWTVILKRKLKTADWHDTAFLPGDEVGVSFGLSIMDNTLDQHYASSTEEKLVLLSRETVMDRSRQ